MKKIFSRLMLVIAIAIPVGVTGVVIAATSSGAASVCRTYQGAQFCGLSVQDVQVEIAGNNMAVALGTLGVNNASVVKFDAPSRNACLQVGRLPNGSFTKYLGNYVCQWSK